MPVFDVVKGDLHRPADHPGHAADEGGVQNLDPAVLLPHHGPQGLVGGEVGAEGGHIPGKRQQRASEQAPVALSPANQL